MTKWMCSHCGYQLEAKEPPDKCPSCSRDCSFIDVSCYTPECGTEGNVDPRLAKSFALKKSSGGN